MRIARYRECCHIAHALNRILGLGSFMEEIIIFDFLRRSLEEGERLVECHGECNTSKILSMEEIRKAQNTGHE